MVVAMRLWKLEAAAFMLTLRQALVCTKHKSLEFRVQRLGFGVKGVVL